MAYWMWNLNNNDLAKWWPFQEGCALASLCHRSLLSWGGRAGVGSGAGEVIDLLEVTGGYFTRWERYCQNGRGQTWHFSPLLLEEMGRRSQRPCLSVSGLYSSRKILQSVSWIWRMRSLPVEQRDLSFYPCLSDKPSLLQRPPSRQLPTGDFLSKQGNMLNL